MILDEDKSRVLSNSKISSLKLDDGESSLKWCELVELVFNGDLEVKLNGDDEALEGRWLNEASFSRWLGW